MNKTDYRLQATGYRIGIALLLLALHAWAAEPVRYTVTLRDPAHHILHVKMEAPTKSALTLQLPVWNALYQIRDFAQYVTRVQGSSPMRRVNTSRWRLEPVANASMQPVADVVEYDTVANLPGSFGFQLDSRHAFLNLAECLMYAVELRSFPVELRVAGLPAGWKIATALPEQGGAYQARNYDHLVDNPLEMGPFQEFSFRQGAAGYRVVIHSEPEAKPAQLQKLQEILERIVGWETQLMGGAPFQNYTFIYHFIPNAGGGMEHSESTAIGASWPEDTGDPAAWQGLAYITAHEFFHLWNVKRIRPKSLEPVDYTQEQPSPSLWFSEGFTSTYGTYALLRTGMATPQRFLEQLQSNIQGLEQRPASQRQPAYESSLETWFDKYPNYRAPERSISYYNKGEIVGYLLDLALRQASAGRHGLDDLMRLMNDRYAKRGLFFDEDRDIQKAAEELGGQSFQDFFDVLVRSSAPVDYNRYLAAAGFKIEEKDVERGSLGFAILRERDAPARVAEPVLSGVPLAVGDQVLEINGRAPQRAPRSLKPGDEIRVKVQRDGRTQEVTYPAPRARITSYVISEIPGATEMQAVIRRGWLASRADR